jgi:hypothetical protein
LRSVAPSSPDENAPTVTTAPSTTAIARSATSTNITTPLGHRAPPSGPRSSEYTLGATAAGPVSRATSTPPVLLRWSTFVMFTVHLCRVRHPTSSGVTIVRRRRIPIGSRTTA